MEHKKIIGHPEVLTQEAKDIISILSEILPSHFYMAGGTSLALQIGHRISIDFDFFTQNQWSEMQSIELIESMKINGNIEILENKEDTMHVRFKHVLLSFFYYPYKLLSPTLSWHNIQLAQCEDIAAMKLNALIRRGSKKDFIDMFFLSQKLGLKKIFDLSLNKFSSFPSFYLQAARALVFFEDAEREPLPKMLIKTNWYDLKHYFEIEAQKIVKKKLQ